MTGREAITTKHITLNVAEPTNTSPPNYNQFAVPSPLKSYVLTRHKKRTERLDQNSSSARRQPSVTIASAHGNTTAAGDPIFGAQKGSAAGSGTAGQPQSSDSDTPEVACPPDLQRCHACGWQTEREVVSRPLKRAGGTAPHRLSPSLSMSGRGAHMHHPGADTLNQAVWTPNADLYYGKGIKAHSLKIRSQTCDKSGEER